MELMGFYANGSESAAGGRIIQNRRRRDLVVLFVLLAIALAWSVIQGMNGG